MSIEIPVIWPERLTHRTLSLFRIFSVPVLQGVNDDAQFRSFIEKYYVGSADSSTVDRIMAAYPVDPDFVSQYVQSHIHSAFSQRVHLGFTL